MARIPVRGAGFAGENTCKGGNWIEYRTVAESLKHENFLYITSAGPYENGKSFPDFVERFESYISKENTRWASAIEAKENGKKG